MPALVDHKASRAKHRKQREFKPAWKIIARGQMRNSDQLHIKKLDNKQKRPKLRVSHFYQQGPLETEAETVWTQRPAISQSINTKTGSRFPREYSAEVCSSWKDCDKLLISWQ